MLQHSTHHQNKTETGVHRSNYLVYTSVGDHSNIDTWLTGNQNFDLWVTYYGNQENRYKDISDHYNIRRGGKFPNLHYVYQKWKNILDQYQAILVMDDDIIINASSISRLFEIREKYDIWVLQPAFDLTSKISHPINRVKPFTFLRYTNFIEVTCPLFRKDKLDTFMKVYDPILVGWGIDWWFLYTIKPEINQNKVAIIDAIACHNPPAWEKGGKREIDKLQGKKAREQKWLEIKKQYEIQTPKEYLEYGSVTYVNGQWLIHILWFYCIKCKLRTKKFYGNILQRLRIT